MKKTIALLLTLCLLSGCAARPAEPQQGSDHTITDDLGRSVTVGESPRTAALLGSFAQIWMLAGGEVCATADDAWNDLVLQLEEDTVNLGSIRELSLELLLSAKPDFILASANTRQHLQWKETLEATGIPVAYFNVSDFEDYLRMLEICTAITDRMDVYVTRGLSLQRQIDECIARAAERGTSPRVLYLRASATSIRAKNSRGSVLGEMLADLGCINIADTDDTLLENLSVEHILMQDPEFIFIVRLGDDEDAAREHVNQFFRDNPALESLTAVKNNRVIFLDKRMYNMKPNNLWAQAYLYLEDILLEG